MGTTVVTSCRSRASTSPFPSAPEGARRELRCLRPVPTSPPAARALGDWAVPTIAAVTDTTFEVPLRHVQGEHAARRRDGCRRRTGSRRGVRLFQPCPTEPLRTIKKGDNNIVVWFGDETRLRPYCEELARYCTSARKVARGTSYCWLDRSSARITRQSVRRLCIHCAHRSLALRSNFTENFSEMIGGSAGRFHFQ